MPISSCADKSIQTDQEALCTDVLYIVYVLRDVYVINAVHVRIVLQIVSTDTVHVQVSLQVDHAAIHVFVSCGA